MAELDPDTTVARAEGLIVETLADQVVILDPATDTYLRLNLTGSFLWEELVEPATIAQLSERLAASAGIDPERAREDTLAFVRALIEHGAASVSPGGR